MFPKVPFLSYKRARVHYARGTTSIKALVLSKCASRRLFGPFSIFSHPSSNYRALGAASQLNKWYFDLRNDTRPHKAPFHVERAFYYTVIVGDDITHSAALEGVRVHLIK